jgi:hypothetical protein
MVGSFWFHRMDDVEKVAITAIRDMKQEGFIAASLQRLGWKVLYRATSIDGLLQQIDEKSDLLIVASDDFRGIERIHEASLIKIRGDAHGVDSPSKLDPRSEHELQKILQTYLHDLQNTGAQLQPFPGKILAFASIGRSVGTSTIALNLAQEIYLQEEATLLVDANFSHPTFARYFDLHGITRISKVSSFGFSVAEIAQIDDLNRLNERSPEFDCLLVDMGQLQISQRTAIGRRLEDCVTSWVLQSMASLHIVTRDNVDDFKELSSALSEIRGIAPLAPIHHIITLNEVLSRREREKRAQTAREITGIEVTLLSRDRKSLERAAAQRSTLAESAPKSLLRNEMVIHLDECGRRGNLRSL